MRHLFSALLLFCLTWLVATNLSAQHLGLPSPVIPEGLGVNIHFTDPEPGEMESLAASGVRWVRMDLLWAATEPSPGHYDFSAYDRLLQTLQTHGLRALLILDYGNPLYDQGLAPHSEEGRQAFARWTVTAARHFSGKGILWEIWNEPHDKIFWRPKSNVKAYLQLALEVGKAYRQAGLEESLVGPAIPGRYFGFLQKCLEAGLLEYWSAVTLHPYRWFLTPETAGVLYVRARAQIQKHAPPGKEIGLLSGEWGYSDVQLGVNPTLQAKYLARMWLFNLSQGIGLSIWYDWRDDGTDPHNKEYHFGMVARDLSPKPAYRAAKTLIGTLRGFRFERRLWLGGSRDYLLVFQNGEERRWAVWNSSPKSHLVKIPGLSGRFRVLNFTGEKETLLTANSQGLSLKLGDGPQYLVPVP